MLPCRELMDSGQQGRPCAVQVSLSCPRRMGVRQEWPRRGQVIGGAAALHPKEGTAREIGK